VERSTCAVVTLTSGSPNAYALMSQITVRPLGLQGVKPLVHLNPRPNPHPQRAESLANLYPRPHPVGGPLLTPAPSSR
jgi:hypothetical protein